MKKLAIYGCNMFYRYLPNLDFSCLAKETGKFFAYYQHKEVEQKVLRKRAPPLVAGNQKNRIRKVAEGMKRCLIYTERSSVNGVTAHRGRELLCKVGVRICCYMAELNLIAVILI